MVLVDTTIWSLALRCRQRDLNSMQEKLVSQWRSLVRSGRATLIGSIRQEVLSGIRHGHVCRGLQSRLSDFPYLEIGAGDYDRAAEFFNICRSDGIVTGDVDMLICAAAHRHDAAIFTTDNDFRHYGERLPIKLHEQV